ncbi:dipeptide/oligopeptide/nickel ABC transporter permease/ATP-binding protein [Arthrobacter sp. MMS18-M83]|uniref:dipeptide/oligopeptide/nickel ABC transporter permease/ATP-binding protein n=1 Tax=Arthrobacter sp. MMS18-M83 TaxID=2996261 RepID=UPI00227CBBA9|nr:dipeptide/oligopeptide/nickel ABC transporter permease/ATP-binding protein [Arthrobacter sp. MMS18-M83]WAH98478.1 dipeptide/oligopeptide/nickel ABC transporter permease/ATP-binding protein [Arthrobacter sp. MMS18-M83]
MTLATEVPTGVEPVVARPGLVRRFLGNPLGLASCIVLAVIIVVAIVVPLLGVPDPNAVNLREAMQPPSGRHLLGTDGSGRDTLSRLLWGSRVNLIGAAIALVVALVIGVSAGLVAGYYGGWFDTASSWFNNLNMALPGIVILLAVRAVVGPSVWIAMTIFGVHLAPSFYRVVRGAVQAVKNELYVDAARVSGLSDARIIARHILTVVRAPVIIQAARVASIAVAIQAGLEFLGVSDNSVPSWGNMLNEGFRKIVLNPSLILWPSLAIGLMCMALVLFGNALRDALEERGHSGTSARAAKAPKTAAPAAAPSAGTSTTAAPASVAARPEEALLSVRDLKVAYGTGATRTEVVHGVSFHVGPGEVLGLVGESGSGKTQTAFAVLGLLPDGGRVSGGSITFDGKELTALGKAERGALRGTDIAYVPQEPMSNLDPSFRIGYQLTVPMRTRLGLSKQDAEKRALALLARVGIADPEKTFKSYPHEISGGMAQRVLIAGAVSCNPRLLIADEPTTALDVTVQAEVLDLLRDLQRETGMAVVLVTHNFGVVADICNKVAVMQAGRIVEMDDVEKILTDPDHEYTRKLLNSMLEDGAARPYPFDDDILFPNDAMTSPTQGRE